MATSDQLRRASIAQDGEHGRATIRNAAQAIGNRRLSNHVVALGDPELTRLHGEASALLDCLLDRYDEVVPEPD